MDNLLIQDSKILQNLETPKILAQENFEAIKFRACDYIDVLDWDNAVVFSDILEEKLKQVQVENKQDQLYRTILWFWVFKLKMFAFNNLSSSERINLLKEYLATMFSLGLDVKGYIQDALGVYGSLKPIQDDAQNLIIALTKSNERLGSNVEAFKNKNFLPTVANWLKEYQGVLGSEKVGSNNEAGAFHILKFLDNSPFVKFLSIPEKEVLRSILDLYNWLLSPVSYNHEKEKKSATPYMQSQQFELPKQVAEESQNQSLTKKPPLVPLPKNAPVINSMEDISSKTEIINTSQAEALLKKTHTVMPPSQAQSRMNIQDILKSRYEQEEGLHSAGLSIGGGAPQQPKAVQPQPPAPASKTEFTPGRQERQEAQADIDKKLEDLEKRMGIK